MVSNQNYKKEKYQVKSYFVQLDLLWLQEHETPVILGLGELAGLLLALE